MLRCFLSALKNLVEFARIPALDCQCLMDGLKAFLMEETLKDLEGKSRKREFIFVLFR